MEIKKVIVTGATGCVGVNFLNYLSGKGIETVALVRPNSARAADICQMNYVKVIECDLSRLSDFENEEHFDVFYHFGWENGSKEYRNDPCKQNKNIQFTLDAVKLAAKLGCKTFIGTGSQAEYGSVSDIISPDTPAFPESAYGAAKLCAYKSSQIYANTLNLQHIWARIFSVFGPYDNPGTLINYVIAQLLQNKTPSVTKGEQLWDYLYAEDLARALYLLGKYGVQNSVYCLGGGHTRPIKEYIEVIRDYINPKAPINWGGMPYGHNQIMHLCADIRSLTKDTGFSPEISFEEGVKRTVAWHRELLNQA